MALKKVFRRGNELLQDIVQKSKMDNGFTVWWLGQSGFLIQYRKKHLLFDPYLSNSLTLKYEKTDKPHVRITEIAIDAAQLDMIDVVTSSHNHTDHLDAETLQPLLAANPEIRFVVPEANRIFAADRCGISPNKITGIVSGQSVRVGEFELIGVPAAHNDLSVNHLDQHHFMGFLVRFGKYTLYHSGDTLWFDGLTELLQPYQVDVAFLPINGNKPERKVAGNLNADEAANLGKQIGAKLVIPHHFDLFVFNTENPANFVEAAERYQTPYHILEIGESLTID